MSPAVCHARRHRGCGVKVRLHSLTLSYFLLTLSRRHPRTNENRKLGFRRRITALHFPTRILCGIAGEAYTSSLLEHLLHSGHLLHADCVYYPSRYEARPMLQ